MRTDSFITRHPPRTALNIWFTHVHSNQSAHGLFRNIFLLWFRFVPDSTETSPPNVSGVDAIQNLQGVSENLKCPAETIVHNISPRLCMSLASYKSAALVFLAARQSNHLGCSLLSQRICRHCAPSCKLDGPARTEECWHMSTLWFSCAKSPMNAYGGVCACKYAYAHALSKLVEKWLENHTITNYTCSIM